jgi:pimeloyl-ACP methyl ester carboxylesterase
MRRIGVPPRRWRAARTWRDHGGRVVPDYDLKLARTLQGADLQHLPTLWTHFDALARVPLMVIRGANSDMLAPTTLEAMLSRRSEVEIAVVPDQGHAPLLAEPKLIRRIVTFVASCDIFALPRRIDRARPDESGHRSQGSNQRWTKFRCAQARQMLRSSAF